MMIPLKDDHPEIWRFELWSDGKGGQFYRNGTGVKVEPDHSLTYTCPCGELFNRHPGEKNELARNWFGIHKHHIPQSAPIVTEVLKEG